MHTIAQLRSGELSGLRRLQLRCGLTSFPSEIFDLADTLEVLDLSGNALSELPDDLPRLHRLRVLFCSENQFTEWPRVLGRCLELSMVGFKANRINLVPAGAMPPRLRWLILTDNAIETLPDDIGDCAAMQKLMLAGNRLRALPESLAGCQALELLRIAANRIDRLPGWLLAMPRLAWLAFAGNPLGGALQDGLLAGSPIRSIDWSRLQLGPLLGEGASGVIHRASLRSANGDLADVAVKLFKAAVTSDGLPQSEMAASIGAGRHPNLTGVLGRVAGHPAGADGLVMELVDPQLTILAGPPSLSSCTRDVYPAACAFDLATVLRIVQGVASAARQLHQRGIMHGDLYGHNILHDGRGRTVIGDFGAASFYDTGDRDAAAALQRIEVRAFGYLLEELLEHCSAPADDAGVLTALGQLRSECLSGTAATRPVFSQIDDLLAAMATRA